MTRAGLARVSLTAEPVTHPLAAITGGGLGNLVNRLLVPRGVVDWIDIGLGTVRWPVFNLADVAITVGAMLLVISFRREGKTESERGASTDASE